MSIRRCVGLWIILGSIGCASFQDFEYQAAQRSRARRAWWHCPDQRCSSFPWSHYSCGWRQGYYDVLMGGDGQCPPVPPQHYWSHKYQSDRGDMLIGNWFQGYRDGSSAALASCQGSYHEIPMSGSLRECLPGCLPADMAAYPVGRSFLSIKRDPVDEEPEEPAQMPDTPKSAEPVGHKAQSSSDAASEDETPVPPSPITQKTSSATKTTLHTASNAMEKQVCQISDSN